MKKGSEPTKTRSERARRSYKYALPSGSTELGSGFRINSVIYKVANADSPRTVDGMGQQV
jgi:hypothetical protein